MIELLKSIKDNYDIFIDTNKIHKLGATTINDIFLINIDNKKWCQNRYMDTFNERVYIKLCTPI